MLHKYDLKIKSIYENTKGTYYDIFMNGKYFNNVEAPYEHNCESCHAFLSCPYAFFTKTSNSINNDCLANYGYKNNILLYFLISDCLVLSLARFFIGAYVENIAVFILVSTIGALLAFPISFICKNIIIYLKRRSLYHKLLEKEKRNSELSQYSEKQIKDLKKLATSYNWGENTNQSLQQCINILEELLQQKANNQIIDLNIVSYIFEALLPNIMNILIQYSAFIDAEQVTAKNTKKLDDTLTAFLEYLNLQKNKFISKRTKFAKKNFENSTSKFVKELY